MTHPPPPDRPPSVSVCIATCRRPDHLGLTLKSVLAQAFEKTSPTLQIQIVENDEAEQGRAVVEQLGNAATIPVRYDVEPRRGISFARNRLVANSGNVDFIAFMDDDEVADPQWLDELLATALETAADAVLGPVYPVFPSTPPDWLSPFFERPEDADRQRVGPGAFRTSNVLLRRSSLEPIDGPFDPRFGLTGGSDTLLGEQLHRRGCSLVWAASAVVRETVPQSRLKPSWVLQRRFRSGMVYTMAQQVVRGPFLGATRGAYRGVGTLAVHLPRLVLSALKREPRSTAKSAGELVYAVGNLCGALGVRYHEYKRVHSV